MVKLKRAVTILCVVFLLAIFFVSAQHAHGASSAVTAPVTSANNHSSMQQSVTDNLGIYLYFFIVFMMIFGLIFFMSEIAGKDLMQYSPVKKVLKSRYYPKILQIPTFVFFGFIIYYFFWGSLSYANNPGSILSWTLWWPLVPLTFILFGRMWCLICPLPIIGDFFQKFTRPTRKPGQFLIKYGIWITDGMFIAITLFDRLYGMVDKPWLSGMVFLFILFGAVSVGLIYGRRTFCKYLCFLGGVSGNYSMLSSLSIEAKDKMVCASCKTKACYFGSGSSKPCPYYNIIPTKTGMRNCTLCAECIKSCPHDNIAVRVRNFASELWSHTKVSFEESFFAKLMVGIVIIQNLGMLFIWSDIQSWIMQNLGVGEKAAIVILYFAAITIPLLLMAISSTISNKLQSKPESAVSNFAAFGYAFIPIDVAAHIAHNTFHLISEGKSILGAFMGLFSGNVTIGGALAGNSFIRGLQFAWVAVGSLGTLYVGYKIARAREEKLKDALKIFLPHVVLLLLIIAINIFMFNAEMAHRGG